MGALRVAPARVLVVGVPRSGTTWVAEVLGLEPGQRWVNEPDNWESDPFAHVGTLDAGAFRVLSPGDRDRRYELMWDIAFRGGWPSGRWHRLMWTLAHRLPRPAAMALLETSGHLVALLRPQAARVLVKSVFAIFALDWVVDRYAPTVVVVRSAPLNVVSSWVTLGWTGGHIDAAWVQRNFPVLASAAEGKVMTDAGRAAFAVGVFVRALERAVAARGDWVVVDHETLCDAPVEGFRRLYERLELEWSARVEAHIDLLNRPGTGMERSRVSATQPARWRRLTADQLDEAGSVLAALGVDPSPQLRRPG